MKLLLSSVLASALCSATVAVGPITDSAVLMDYDFQAYMKDFDLKIPEAEQPTREKVFKANLAEVLRHNSGSAKQQPLSSYVKGITRFAHLTKQEFVRNVVRGYNKGTSRYYEPQSDAALEAPLHEHVSADELPSSKDWRDQSPSVVTPVKNQGGCGSCWAFSATESMESHIAIEFGKLFDLSPQELVDCAPNPDQCGGTGGCDGSTAELAFKYVSSGAGLVTDKQYPYKAKTDSCGTSALEPVATIGGYVQLPTNNGTALLNAIQKQPISISVDASNWGLYAGGVFDDAKCGTGINHAVQLVGYGTEGSKAYWIVRNSWGEGWGEEGFIKIARFGDSPPCAMDNTPQDGYACKGQTKPIKVCGLCGMLSDSSYPTGGKLL